jgi:hypothetical protein
MIHMTVQAFGGVILLPLEIHANYKLLLTTAFTVAGCFLIYEFIIRRVRFLHPFFGIIAAK